MQKVEISKIEYCFAKHLAKHINKNYDKQFKHKYFLLIFLYWLIVTIFADYTLNNCIYLTSINKGPYRLSGIKLNKFLFKTSLKDYLIITLALISLILFVLFIMNNIISKTMINVFQQNITYQVTKNEQVINIPKVIDYCITFRNKLFLFKKENNEYKFLTIIDRNEKNFDEQKFWQTHRLLLDEYFKGNLPLKPESTNTQKEA